MLGEKGENEKSRLWLLELRPLGEGVDKNELLLLSFEVAIVLEKIAVQL